MRRLTIDPLTRLEGHGRVEIFLDDEENVAEAYLVVPELRGFERLCVGRPVEEMPGLTARVCGLCPEAHHMASAVTLDHLFGVEPTPAARVIRQLLYCAFLAANHATHFFALAGPDLLLGEDTPPEQRNLFGVLTELGPDISRRVLAHRVANHEVIEWLGGRRIQPVAAVPGGWTRAVDEATRHRVLRVARENVDFALACLQIFQDRVLPATSYRQMASSGALTQPTYSMGTVDHQGRLAFMEGDLRVVDPDGGELARFPAQDYRDHIAERVEPFTYLKLPFLRSLGWNGLSAGSASGIYTVGPLARLNVCGGLSTPLAQQAWEGLYEAFGRRDASGRSLPIHDRLVTHSARLVEQLHAAELMVELASRPELTDHEVRQSVPSRPVCHEAVGSVEAPRGTLIHRYATDENGLVTEVDLVVATTHNHAAIAMSVASAARALIRPGVTVGDGLLNRVEMAIRTHDPCLACATHSFPDRRPLRLTIRNAAGLEVAVVER